MTENLVCTECGLTLSELSPSSFSFNSPLGACPECTGIGSQLEVDPHVLIVDPDKPLREALIEFSGRGEHFFEVMDKVAENNGFSITGPWKRLTKPQQDLILYGSEKGESVTWDFSHIDEQLVFTREYEGLIPMLRRRMEKSQSSSVRAEILSLMAQTHCDHCKGSRLKPEVLAVLINGHNIHDITRMSITDCHAFFTGLEFEGMLKEIGQEIKSEILSRLDFLLDVGLPYLTLNRSASTLSGGEMQRIHLACQIGSRLTGVLYVLDEPTIGLHPHDTQRLISTLNRLKKLGNSLILVEHDGEIIQAADYLVDLGPGAGERGGEIMFAGDMKQFKKSDCLTALYMSGKKSIPIPKKHRKSKNGKITIVGARQHNLKGIDVDFPVGQFICVTGISGSGKSTLINDILYSSMKARFRKHVLHGQFCDEVKGIELVDKVINIDQSPLGRTSRSNPATYTGISDQIRDLFCLTRESRLRGYKSGRFSFNVKGGRCEICEGEGLRKIEMHFLPDMHVTCEACNGSRFNRETLEIRYKGMNIAQVLDATVEEMYDFFKEIPALKRKLGCLKDVGLGYIRLGQSSSTLSGGEAQRVKLAFELSKVSTGKTLYILDEPTTGLHFHDTAGLVKVLEKLADLGNTVVIIEHNLDVIKVADHVIELGPGGGDEGGYLTFTGTPEELVKCKKSLTGKYLKAVMK
jgi:excinuclease ABC subunit A